MENGNLLILAEQIGKLALNKNIKICTAESCTGGWLSQVITAVAGSSQWFERGFVTYSNEAKQQMLGVPMKLIENYGAVSEQVALAMAEGALKNSLAQFSFAITGIAGPSGGSPEKPVGMVCFAWAYQEKIITECCYFKGDRQSIRIESVHHALEKGKRYVNQ